MKRTLLAVLIAVAVVGCFAHRPPVVSDEPDPTLPTVYTVPLDAKDTDLVCADTRPGVNFKPCMKVRRFRAFVLDPKL